MTKIFLPLSLLLCLLTGGCKQVNHVGAKMGVRFLAAAPQTFPVAAGSSAATIQSVIKTAAAYDGPATVLFAPGSYSVASTVSVPCPSFSLTVEGTPSAYPGPYTANLTGAVNGGAGFALSACSNPQTWSYLNWYGGQPNGGGGGFMYVAPGTSNLTVTYNKLSGSSSNVSTSHEYDSQIWLDGPQANSPVDSNVNLSWNQIGGPNDCNAIMSLFVYQGGKDYGAVGGYCGGIGVHVSTNGIVIKNNNFNHVEQGVKFYAGKGGPGNPAGQIQLISGNVSNNDFAGIHRIGVESQQVVAVSATQGSTFTFANNSFHDQINPGFGSFFASIPACCASYTSYSADNANNLTGNVFAGNVPAPAGGFYVVAAMEFWSSGTCSNNLIQGYPSGGCLWGYGSGSWSANNNLMQTLVKANAVQTEGEGGGKVVGPTQVGNVTTSTLSALVSAAPTISPAPSGNYTMNQVVSLTDAGRTNSVGPLGHTSSYYTTDGGTPTTSSTFCGESCTFTIQPGTTVKAIGMWGDQNQPKSYPAGYGFVPSAVQSWTFTGSGGTPVTPPVVPPVTPPVVPPVTPPTPPAGAMTNGYLGTPNSVNTAAVCSTVQFTAYGCVGSTCSVVKPTSWTSSNPAVGTVSASGLFTALTSGSTNIQAQLSSTVASSYWTMKTAALPPSASIGLAPGTTTVVVAPCGSGTVTGSGISALTVSNLSN